MSDALYQPFGAILIAAFGVYLVLPPQRLMRVGSGLPLFLLSPDRYNNIQMMMASARQRRAEVSAKPPPLIDPDTAARIQAAIDYRASREMHPRWVSIVLGAFAIFLAVLVLGGQLSTYNALGMLGFTCAVAFGVTYTYLRRPLGRRAAPLTLRHPGAPVGLVWYVVAVAMIVAVLWFATVPVLRVSGMLVAVATLVELALAFSIARMPAVLSGADPTIELIIDNQIRLSRTNEALMFAYLQIVFFLLAVPAKLGPSGAAAIPLFCLIAFVAFLMRKRSALFARTFLDAARAA